MGKSRPKNKSKIIFISLIIIFCLIIISFIFPLKKTKFPTDTGLMINNNSYYLEIASTPKQRQIGLSKRTSLCPNCGMLFIFEKEGIYPFWMKDTYVPLDIIWLDNQNKIIKIATVLETNSEKTYVNQQKAKYVIELNANETFKLDLKVGDTILLPSLND